MSGDEGSDGSVGDRETSTFLQTLLHTENHKCKGPVQKTLFAGQMI